MTLVDYYIWKGVWTRQGKKIRSQAEFTRAWNDLQILPDGWTESGVRFEQTLAVEWHQQTERFFAHIYPGVQRIDWEANPQGKAPPITEPDGLGDKIASSLS